METRRSSRLRIKTQGEANNSIVEKPKYRSDAITKKASGSRGNVTKKSISATTDLPNEDHHANSTDTQKKVPITHGRPVRSAAKNTISYAYTEKTGLEDSSESSTSISSDSDEMVVDEHPMKSNVKKRMSKSSPQSSSESQLPNKRSRKQTLISSSSSESDSGSDTGSDSENSLAPTGKNFQKQKKIAKKFIRGKSRKNEPDVGDVNWPKCRKASIARKTGNPAGSKTVKSGLRMATRVKPEQPWKKNVLGYEADRQLAKGERRMKEYRKIASLFVLGKTSEVSYDECYKLHEKMKQAYKENRPLGEAVGGSFAIRACEENSVSSSEDEWEEMEHFNPTIDKQIEVTLEEDEEVEKDWWVIYLRQEANKKIRETWENTHKVHLLCYLAHLKFQVKIALDEGLVPSLMISQLPPGYMKPVGGIIPVDVLRKLLLWFSDTFRPRQGDPGNPSIPDDGLEARYPETRRLTSLIESKSFETDLDRATLLFCLLSGMETTVRICVNAQVISRKWTSVEQKEVTESSNTTTSQSKNKQKGETNRDKEEPTSSNKSKIPTDKKKDKTPKKWEERNYWVEYWQPKEKRWICVDPFKKAVDEPLEIHKNSAHPISYVFAIDNKRGVCDVSRRYAMDCVKQDFRRRRTDANWLFRTLNLPVFTADFQRKKWEQMQMWEDLIKRPLPVTMSEYKNHPLYVLEKDLLKFEAIYPPPKQQKPLGQIRGHNVYPRSTVFTLQGENNWLKLARSVKVGEEPYKVVKARPDPRIPVEDRVDQFLNVYGYWQTEPYRRQPLENGKIPRNEYGNVYMFNENMCPLNCVHLKLSGLVQIARKLNKQCVPAVVGWAFDGGWTHPVMDGAIVLEADEKAFRKEWETVESGRAEREESKRIERVYGNWKKFIKGVLRLAYVRKQFGMSSKSTKAEIEGVVKSPSETVIATVIDNSSTTAQLAGFSLEDFIPKKK